MWKLFLQILEALTSGFIQGKKKADRELDQETHVAIDGDADLVRDSILSAGLREPTESGSAGDSSSAP